MQYCEKCLNKGFDSAKGVVCSLTGDKPNYSGECPDFKQDPELIKLEEWRKDNVINPDRYSRWSAGEEGSHYKLNNKLFVIGFFGLLIGICLSFYSIIKSHHPSWHLVYWTPIVFGISRIRGSFTEKGSEEE